MHFRETQIEQNSDKNANFNFQLHFLTHSVRISDQKWQFLTPEIRVYF